MRRRARVDANHAQVRETLRRLGWLVIDCAHIGGGWPDLVAVRRGRCVFVEVKDGRKALSRQRLTVEQQETHAAFAAFGYPIAIVTSVEEALAL